MKLGNSSFYIISIIGHNLEWQDIFLFLTIFVLHILRIFIISHCHGDDWRINHLKTCGVCKLETEPVTLNFV